MNTKLSSIIIVAAPSGTGKTTLTRRLVKESPDLSFSISMTTRPMRKGEIDGKHYWYVDKKTFMQHVQNNEMVEWANVFGNLYGTSKKEIQRIQNKGQRTLLEIDVQGAASIRKIYKDACSIFIIPPSVESLWNRLKERGTDPLETRWLRLQTACKELSEAQHFEHFIINENLEKAYNELKNLVQYSHEPSLNYKEGLTYCEKLIKEFEKPEWQASSNPKKLFKDSEAS